MVAGMALKILRGAGHVSNVYGAVQAAGAVGGSLWGSLVIVSTLAFGSVQAVANQGWGAMFLAGLAVGSVAALCLAGLMFGLAALARAYRWIRPLPPPVGEPGAVQAGSSADVRDALAGQAGAAQEELRLEAERLACRQDEAEAKVTAGIAGTKTLVEGYASTLHDHLTDAFDLLSQRLDAVQERLGALEEGTEARSAALATILHSQYSASVLASIDHVLARIEDLTSGADTIRARPRTFFVI
jgi:hypothetical protein